MKEMLEFNFHDAELLSIEIQKEERAISFGIKSAKKHKHLLTLDGYNRFRVVDFSTQNIAERLVILTGATCDIGVISSRLEWMSSFVDTGPMLSKSTIAEFADEVLSGSLVLAHWIPSVGAEFVALCKAIHVK